jgi:hypothetical protein
MAFINSLKFLVRFGNTSAIREEVSQTNITVLGDNSTAVVSDSGYLMQDDQYLFGDGLSSNGYNTSITEEYTLGFWLYSVSPGLAIDSTTGNLLSIEMPVISFVDGSSAEHSIIEITEHTQTSGNNSLKVSERGGYSAFSEEYEVGKWHHFWVARNSSGLRIFIDSVENTLQDEEGTLATKVTEGLNSYLYTYINHSLDGYGESVAKNGSIIDDVFLLDVRNVSQSDMQRVINDGVLFMVDDIYTSSYVEKSSIYMNDPEMITINSMVDDLSYIFVGRNDGKIMRGTPLFWETRRSFSNSEEYQSGGIDSSLEGAGADDGFLVLNQKTVRL